ncbi:MAG: stage V sporulation protein AC [Clostridia bacterium]|jgi:stage V sporulation protein AC|nr:stage V sporulation protein AC [Clostridia bacterium]MDH7572696.1 stage V sporulation protein AC [Clostridia bacterium]
MPEPLDGQLRRQQQQYDQAAYQKLVGQSKPKPPVARNALAAFILGGALCALGQLIVLLLVGAGMSPAEATTATAMIMVFLGALLTGLGVYDTLAKWGGAGAIVPITGFANSIVAPAMEFKHEGFVFGVGARMFTVAGPVLVYGLVTAILMGLLTWVLK